MKTILVPALFLSAMFVSPGDGAFSIKAKKSAVVCEVVYQSSGSAQIEICITNDGPAVMDVTTKCSDSATNLNIEVGVGETKCQCCNITETKVCIPKDPGEATTTGSYTTGACTAPL